jgi:hypothetical protein
VIVLASLLFLREPRLQRYDERYLRWLLHNSRPVTARIPLSIVDIGGEPNKSQAAPSPLELSLFVQAALEFKPTVVAFEPILQWPESSKEQEQILVDQAMRVPKMLAAAELTATADPDAPVIEIAGFTNVTGRRGDLPVFSGIARQPDEDIRLLSTLGFINLPNDVADEIRVPLLFQYRGEVIPSFALQTALLWMRITPNEVKIDIGSFISLPNGKKIPIRFDGTALINPNAARRARHLRLDELLLAAQQHEKKAAGGATLEDMRDDIVLARGAAPSNTWAATIATIQSNSFVRRVSWAFDCVFILVLVLLSTIVRRFSRIDIVLMAIAITAAYCMLALTLVSRWSIWLPGVLPLGAVWLVAAFCLFAPRGKNDPDLPTVAPSPPSL